MCAGPGHHRRGIRAGLHGSEPDLTDQRDATGGHLGEVGLDQSVLEDRRSGPYLHATRPERGIRPGDGDGQRLQPDDVLGPARHVRLAGRDHRRDPAVERRLDEVDRPLARREVADGRVRVRVDEAGHDRRPARVDDDVGRLVVEVASHRLDPTVDDRDRVAVEQRRVDVARDDLADAGDQRPHDRCLSAGRPRPRRRPPRALRSVHAAGRHW